MDQAIQILISIISGGFIWETFKFFYPDLIRPLIARKKAKKTLYQNIDPILKSAGELYGKLESLAKEDFSSFININNSNSKNPIHNQKYVLYLFAQFWAQIEYLRLESQYTAISKIKKGKELLRFVETIESRKYRILDRSIQRIIGECLISSQDQKFRVLTLKEFLETLGDSTSTLNKCIDHLEKTLLKTHNKTYRQTVLRFGVLVAILIDHFDPKHKTVRRRAIYLNKLSDKSKEMIKHNLLTHYVDFAKNKKSYYQK